MKTYKSILTIILLLLIAYAGLLGYFIITSDVEIDFKINWNMFDSVLKWPLLIVGFIVGLGMKYPSLVPFLKITHPDGEVEYEPNDDIIENMLVRWVMPLIQIFILGPVLIAACIYYPLMALIYLFGKIFPFLILVFFVLTLILFYQWEKIQLTKSEKSTSMTLIALLMIGVLWFLTYSWLPTGTKSLKTTNIVTIAFFCLTVITFIAVEGWIKKQKPYVFMDLRCHLLIQILLPVNQTPLR